MALKVHGDGFVEIKTAADATKALVAFKNLKGEIDELKEESGLNDLEKDAMAYKVAVQNYMVDNDLEQIVVKDQGFHGTLVKGFASSHWIGTDADLTGDEPEHVESLQSIIESKFNNSVTTKGSKARKVWLRITKRTVDQEAIEEVVREGTLVINEISPAFIEKPRAPYLRIFDDNG